MNENNDLMYRGSTLLSKEDILHFAGLLLKQNPSRLKLDYRVLHPYSPDFITAREGSVYFLVSALSADISSYVFTLFDWVYTFAQGSPMPSNIFFNKFSSRFGGYFFVYEISLK